MKERTKGKVRGIWANPGGLPARNETRRVGWAVGKGEAEQISVAETTREWGDASSERRRASRSLERGPGRKAWCGGCERTGKGSSRTEGTDDGQEGALLRLRNAFYVGSLRTPLQASVLILLCIARDAIAALLSNRAIVCTLPCRGAL